MRYNFALAHMARSTTVSKERTPTDLSNDYEFREALMKQLNRIGSWVAWLGIVAILQLVGGCVLLLGTTG